MMVVYIDATDLVLGRLSSVVAKKLLDGEEVVIINAEKAVIMGKKERIFREYREKREIGSSRKGPFFPRMPDRIIKRTVRGMLPKNNAKGRMALKRLKVYIGVPSGIEVKKTEKIDARAEGIAGTTYITVGELSEHMGARF